MTKLLQLFGICRDKYSDEVDYHKDIYSLENDLEYIIKVLESCKAVQDLDKFHVVHEATYSWGIETIKRKVEFASKDVKNKKIKERYRVWLVNSAYTELLDTYRKANNDLHKNN